MIEDIGRPAAPQTEEGLVETIVDRVSDIVSHRSAGHCMQVPHLPTRVADASAQRLWEKFPEPDAVRLVQANPAAPWHATPTKLVELRNAIGGVGGRLVVFVPAGQLLAAEDSIGASTFEVVEVSDAYATLEGRLLAELERRSPAVAAFVVPIVSTAEALGKEPRRVVEYLQRVEAEPTADTAAMSLDSIGLMPDRGLVGLDAERVMRRLRHNAKAIEAMTVPEPPAERVRSIAEELGDRAVEVERDLLDALGDGVLDPYTIARRLAAHRVDFAEWRSVDSVTELDEITILAIVGDVTQGQEPSISKARAQVGVRFRTDPPPAEVDGLAEITLDFMRVGDREDDLFDTGVSSRKRGSQLSRRSVTTWKLRVEVEELEPAFYRFRLSARDRAGVLLGTAMSGLVRVQTDLPAPDPIVRPVASIPTARVMAQGQLGDEAVGEERIVVSEPRSGRVSAQIRWDNLADTYELRMSPLLVEVERYTLDDPESLGRYGVAFGGDGPQETFPTPPDVPSEFLEARGRAFDAIKRAQFTTQGESVPPLVGLADLPSVESVLEAYATSWREAISSADDVEALRALMSVDQLVVRDPGRGELRLAGPTHPLRLLWRLRHSKVLGEAYRRRKDLRALGTVVDAVVPQYIPMVVPGDHGALRSVACFGLDWTVFVRPSASDVPATLSRLADWLGFEAQGIRVAAPREVSHRVARYLRAHPWVETVVLNFIQPGDGDGVLQALLDLQSDEVARRCRYVVRLFASDLFHDELGRTLDEFMASPDESRRWRNDSADALLAASTDPLAPRFTYSKHRLDDLATRPGAFPAHLTFLLDWFELDLEVVRRDRTGRSFFADGLIVEPMSSYRLDDAVPTWRATVTAPFDAADPLERTYAAAHGGIALLLGGERGQDVGVRLGLDRVKQSILDAVHRSSEWVVTIDPVFGDEFLDAPVRPGEPARYVVESGDMLALRPERHVLVSTKSRSELRSLIGPALARHGLGIADHRLERVLDALQSVGAGISLRLLADPNHRDEALSFALAAVWLRNSGILRHALVMPIDAYQGLFRADALNGSRTDLAVIRIDPAARAVTFHLVEVKVRSGLDLGIPADLRAQIESQLSNTRRVLRDAMFDLEERREPGSLTAALRLRSVSASLRRYLDRAQRYHLLSREDGTAFSAFIDSLDAGFMLGFVEHALVFDLDQAGTNALVENGVEYLRVGRDQVESLLAGPDDVLPTVGSGLDFDRVRTAAGGQSAGERMDRPAIDTVEGPIQAWEVAETPLADVLVLRPIEDSATPPTPVPVAMHDGSNVLMLGVAPSGAQFGVVGRIPGGPEVAIDSDGTNVISAFGVQGSGKSYTLGTLIEAVVMDTTPLNRLPRPLGAVVFHYSTDSTYVPEFASMGEANSEPIAVAELGSVYGASPRAVDDVRVLVPPDLVTERSADFPGLDVRPLSLGANELRVDDWKLLMGIEGGDQMYARAMNGIFRDLRSRLSLDSLAAAIDASGLTAGQKRIAQTRLDFARPYISISGSASEHLVPGRVLIIDLRDELIESDEALALFMILLGRFSQAEWEGRHFNKLIVFDEAHKYMADPRLTSKIVETVREMRHKGTSVVIASQNPPSVPREIIELSSVIFAHRFTSPQWLDHIKRANTDFGEAGLRPSQLTNLSSGEAYVWSSGSRDFRRPQLVRVRPRLTRHGGGTRRATD